MEVLELSRRECWTLLETVAVGRIALIRGGLPCVLPVNIRAVEDAVWFRTGPGALLDAALAHHVLSIEADEIDHAWHHAWSVVVTGKAEVVADRSDLPVKAWARTDAAHLVRVEAELVTGRWF